MSSSQWYSMQQQLLDLVRMDDEYKRAIQVVRKRDHLQKYLRAEMLTHNLTSVEVDDGSTHISLQFIAKNQMRVDTKALPAEVRDKYSKEVTMYYEHLVVTPSTK